MKYWLIFLALGCSIALWCPAAQPPSPEHQLFLQTKARADKGDPEAQLELGKMYSDGAGVAVDLRQAARWTRKAAEQGLARAQYQLGIDYATVAGVKLDRKEAAFWVKQAALQGLTEAQYSLGLWYLNGRGLDQDAAEAVKWFRQAAEKGYPDAESELGNCYLEGTGVPKDIEEGLKWLRDAAQKGSASGEHRLAICYQRGKGVPKDNVQAYQWFALAAARDQDRAMDIRLDLAKLETILTPEELATAQRQARNFKQLAETNMLGTRVASAETTETSTGTVEVTAQDDQCELFVDGAFVGNPPAKLKLTPGPHVLEAKRAGFVTLRKEFNISAGAELTLRPVLVKE